jgi:hypothetical protein
MKWYLKQVVDQKEAGYPFCFWFCMEENYQLVTHIANRHVHALTQSTKHTYLVGNYIP